MARPGAGPVALGRVTPGHLSAAPDPSVPPSTEPDLATVPPARAPGPARVDRQEFIRAFAEQSWARPGTDRPVARVHVTLMVTMGALVIAVVTGALLQMVHPVKLSASAAAAPLASASSRYTAVTGWDCATGADRGFDITGRTPEWYTVARGGWAQDGCHGTFEAIPMSGDARKYDQGQSAVWWFTPGAGMTRCDVAVYLPNSEHPADSAATAAQFLVTAGRGGGTLASFVLDQTSQRGAWQPVGTFPVSHAGIAVQLVNQGVPVNAAARLAVTQVRVVCSG